MIAAALPNKDVAIILPNAMTADAATVAPTKRGRKAWLIALAVVVAVVTIALLTNAPKPEPVKVWFVRATNVAGVKRLVFEGTNGTGRAVEVFAVAATGAPRQEKVIYGADPVGMDGYAASAAGTPFTLTLKAPPKDASYHVVWWVDDKIDPLTRWERFRWGCRDFFRAHGMYRIAGRFMPKAKEHYIPSSEIKE